MLSSLQTRRVQRAMVLTAALLSACGGGSKDSTPPPTPTTIVPSVTNITLDAVGATQSLTATVRDQNGATMAGVSATFSSASPAVATVSGGTVTAVANGSTTITATAGSATASIPVTVSQVAVAPSKVAGDAQSGVVGSALPVAVKVKLQDRLGIAIAGRTVTFTPAANNGSANPSTATTGADGTAQSSWTLGTVAGAQALNASVAGITDVAAFAATASAGAPASVAVAGGNGQTALAGSSLTTPLSVSVKDQFGNNVLNQAVTFAVTAGGGSITPSTASTGTTGTASGAVWKLGNRGGTQTATATSGAFSATFTATIQSSYPITLRYFGNTMSTEAQAAFTKAADRLKAAIVTPVITINLGGVDLAGCGINGLTGQMNGATTGIIIYATVRPIDGVGNILGQAGPCVTRQPGDLPAVGVMEFDDADVARYLADGRFEYIVLHEMNHVLGFGTIWDVKNLLLNASLTSSGSPSGSTDPRYIGTAATSACVAAGGAGIKCTAATGIAVEASGGEGTADGHWRESVFDSELMTGYIEATTNMPWSAFSVASFQDLGYTVNLGAADAFTIPNLLTLARVRAEAEASGVREVVHRPKISIGADGVARPIVRPAP